MCAGDKVERRPDEEFGREKRLEWSVSRERTVAAKSRERFGDDDAAGASPVGAAASRTVMYAAQVARWWLLKARRDERLGW